MEESSIRSVRRKAFKDSNRSNSTLRRRLPFQYWRAAYAAKAKQTAPASVDSDPFSNLEPEEPVASDPATDLKQAGPPSIAGVDDEITRCRNCGLPGRLGVRCTACGVPIGSIEL